MDMVDTTKETGRDCWQSTKIRITFASVVTSSPSSRSFGKGAKISKGRLRLPVSNRFMLRRGQVRIDYVHFGKETNPGVQIVFQFDANERGFTVRDVWAGY